MAAVQPYQRVLLENRDILLNDLNTDDVIPLLFLGKVLSNKEIDDIEIGRTRREKTESLLDVLHYKGERGFDEFCKSLEETFPQLAARMSRKDSQTERSGNINLQLQFVLVSVYSGFKMLKYCQSFQSESSWLVTILCSSSISYF
jgi:hypothetical protein